MKTWFPGAGLRATLMAAILALAPVLAPAPARADIPDELYAALGLDKGVAPRGGCPNCAQTQKSPGFEAGAFS